MYCNFLKYRSQIGLSKLPYLEPGEGVLLASSCWDRHGFSEIKEYKILDRRGFESNGLS